jgi:hypothetical protein
MVGVNVNTPEQGGGTVTPTTQHTVPSLRAAVLVHGRSTADPALSLQGEDPTTGLPATWHVAPLAVSR